MNKGKRSFSAKTFGCQMNANDTQKVVGLLRDGEGWAESSDPESADVLFLNTCAVRQRAEEKLYGILHRLNARRDGRQRPIVVVGGCVAQLQGEGLAERFPAIDVIAGPRSLHRIPELIAAAGRNQRVQIALDERGQDAFLIPEPVAPPQPARALVTAMEGCNRVCSFCVVPRTRGVEVCRPLEDVVSEVRRWAAAGVPEVMLLGQTVNAYRWGDHDFAGLLQLAADVPGLRRLRFATSHPSHVNERLARAFRHPVLCPHFHLPVQSGSDAMLAAMRRGYDRRTFLDTVALIRDHAPGVALWTDIIVGYPGESEKDFEMTLDLVETVRFAGLFAFTYSPRPGTTAFGLPDDVAEVTKRRRLNALNHLQQTFQARSNAERVGGREEVLFEQVGKDGRLEGRNPENRIVHCDGPADLVGRIHEVEIADSGPNSLVGRLVDSRLARRLTGTGGAPIL